MNEAAKEYLAWALSLACVMNVIAIILWWNHF